MADSWRIRRAPLVIASLQSAAPALAAPLDDAVLPVLELEPSTGADPVRAIAEFGQHFDGEWGIRWDTGSDTDGSISQVLTEADSPLPWLILACIDEADLARQRALAAELAERVVAEVCSPQAAFAAATAGFDAVVVKGNEAGGVVATSSAFVLLQATAQLDIPVWVQGGFGPDAFAAALVAGASGLVLREELWLTEGTDLEASLRHRVGLADGSETVEVHASEVAVRALVSPAVRPRMADLEVAAHSNEELVVAANSLAADTDEADFVFAGQGIAFAALNAARYRTVGGVADAYQRVARHGVSVAPDQQAFMPGSRAATAHGTDLPVVQGPMTRVSDTPEFAAEVAAAGALPFIALSLMRGHETAEVLADTARTLGDRPWGVGLLGFAPAEVRAEQLEAIVADPPPFAILSGARPSQAAELEAMGTTAYLHVPSPGLLADFLKEGSRRFILEGRECGGHVGPRSSLLLWQQAVDGLLAADIPDLERVQLLLAGGIHDELSAAMAQALVVPLLERGVRVGILMGSAYLFTPEAVSSGAITKSYQQEALRVQRTVLLTSGAGHSTRAAPNPFTEYFQARRSELIEAGAAPKEIWAELELLNVGRLRVASKGMKRTSDVNEFEAKGELVKVDPDSQRKDGLYMLGDVAALSDEVMPVAELHRRVTEGATKRLAESAHDFRVGDGYGSEPIAVVGMACRLPGANDVRRLWANLVEGRSSITEVPRDRFDQGTFFEEGSTDQDKLPSKWGGFIDPFQLDPTEYHMPPLGAAKAIPEQLMMLDVAAAALADADIAEADLPRSRTGVMIGSARSTGGGVLYLLRSLLPQVLTDVAHFEDSRVEEIVEDARPSLPDWSEDVFPGLLTNVVAGRIANRLDLQGPNMAVDAACAASLAALHAGVQQLRLREIDAAVVGGVDASNDLPGFMVFARTHALTGSGVSRPFDKTADGIVLGEGAGAVVLLRLVDAVRLGLEVRAVIRGVGSSSDGRSRSLTAPAPAGQVLALRRAYDNAGVDVGSVGLFEAHGTGTTAGDAAELTSLNRVLEGSRSAGLASLGSIKSNIGHTKTAAGIAGLIKSVLALEQAAIPPTINVDEPNPAMTGDGTLRIAGERRPWVRRPGIPRRAGVSSFGFGGTNYHAVVEEYAGVTAQRVSRSPRPVELFMWAGHNAADLASELRSLADLVAEHPEADLAQIGRAVMESSAEDLSGPVRVAMKVASLDELALGLAEAATALETSESVEDGTVYVAHEPRRSDAEVCFLFPGQGSQYTGMLSDLVESFAFGAEFFDSAAEALADYLPRPLGDLVYPPTPLSAEEKKAQKEALDDTRVAQPALGAANLFASELLQRFGVAPAMAAGHSYGETCAMMAGGFMSVADTLQFSALRGQASHAASSETPGGMLAVSGGAADVEPILASLDAEVYVANYNAPSQVILSGTHEALSVAAAALHESGVASRRVATTAPFHSPLLSVAAVQAESDLANFDRFDLQIPVYGNATALPIDPRSESADRAIAELCMLPVRFVEMLRQMHDDGGRIFIEVGPNRIITALVKRCLDGRDFDLLTLDGKKVGSVGPLAEMLCRLHVSGVSVSPREWYEARGLGTASLDTYLASLDAARVTRPSDLIVTGMGVTLRSEMEPGGPAREVPSAAPTDRVQPAQERTTTGDPSAEVPVRSAASTATAAPVPGPLAGLRKSDPSLLSAPRQQSREEKTHMSSQPGVGSSIETALLSWIELQREQTRLLERMVALHEASAGMASPTPAPRPAPAPAPVAAPVAVPAPAPAPVAAPVAVPAPAPAPVAAPVAVPAPAPAPVAAPVAVPAPAPAPVAAPVVAPAPAAAVSVQPLAATPTPAEQAAPPADAVPASGGNGNGNGNGASLAPAQGEPVAAGGAPSVDEFRADLIAEVVAKTGYPEDMLDLDLALESGLGIDSIKVLEIFGGLNKYHPYLLGDEPPEEQLAEFVQLETLREILDAYLQRVQEHQGSGVPARPFDQGGLAGPEEASQSAAEAAVDPLERVELVAAPREANSADDGVALEGELLFVAPDDPRSSEVARALEGRGISLRRLEWSDTAEFAKAERDLAGVLFWLGEVGDTPPAEFGVERVVSTYEVMQALEDVATECAAFRVLTVSQIDGRHGLSGGPLTASAPASAGPGSVIRSLAAELPDARVRALDVSPQLSIASVADEIQSILAALDGDAEEIGMDEDGRWALAFRNLDQSPIPPDPILDPTAVLLSIGGARGITSGMLIELAKHSPARIVLLGRTDPDGASTPELADLSDPAELRSTLIDLRRAENPDVTPAELEGELAEILKAREVATTLRALATAGAEVEYRIVDATDPENLASTIESVYERYGSIDWVIHAAGVNYDRPLARKNRDEILRGYRSKTAPLAVLEECLQPETLQGVICFGSMSARVTNAEQGDYAAANRYLELWATRMNTVWDAPVRTIAWALWDDGMTGDVLADAVESLGVRLVRADTGAAAFLGELAAPPPQPPIVGLGHDIDRMQVLAREFRLSKILIDRL